MKTIQNFRPFFIPPSCYLSRDLAINLIAYPVSGKTTPSHEKSIEDEMKIPLSAKQTNKDINPRH